MPSIPKKDKNIIYSTGGDAKNEALKEKLSNLMGNNGKGASGQTIADADDIFSLPDIAELEKKAEDMELARQRAEETARQENEKRVKLGDFSQRVSSLMTDLVKRREEARGVSQQNYNLFEEQITQILAKPAEAGMLAKTAYIIACAKKDGGMGDTAALFKDLADRKLAVVDEERGSVRFEGKLYSLSFRSEQIGLIYDALRMRAGDMEKKKTEERRETEKSLQVAGEMPIWKLFEGKQGKCSIYVPFHVVPQRDGEKKVYPGILLVESDGRRVICEDGSGGQERLAQDLKEKGISLSLKELQDENFYSKRLEDALKVVFQRRLWQARKFAGERSGAEPYVSNLRKKLIGKQTVDPAKLVAGANGLSFICYGGADWEVKDSEHAKKYRNVFALVERIGKQIFYREWPRHLDFMFSPYKETDLEGENVERGPGLSFWRWAKNKYSTPINGNVDETPEQKDARLQRAATDEERAAAAETPEQRAARLAMMADADEEEVEAVANAS